MGKDALGLDLEFKKLADHVILFHFQIEWFLGYKICNPRLKEQFFKVITLQVAVRRSY